MVTQAFQKLIQVFFQIQSVHLQAGYLLIMGTGRLNNLLAIGLNGGLLKRQVKVQQNFLDVLFQNDIHPFQTRHIAMRVATCFEGKNLHLGIGKQNALHFDEDFAHDVVLFRIVEHVIVRMESLLIMNVLQYGGLTETRSHNVEIKVFNLRDFAVNLRQQIFVDFGKGGAADEFLYIATITHIALKLNDRIVGIANGGNGYFAELGRSVVERPVVVDL